MTLLSCSNSHPLKPDSDNNKITDGTYYLDDASIILYLNDTIVATTDWQITKDSTSSILIFFSNGDSIINITPHLWEGSYQKGTTACVNGTNIRKFFAQYDRVVADTYASIDFIANEYSASTSVSRFYRDLTKYDNSKELFFTVYWGKASFYKNKDLKIGYFLHYSFLNSNKTFSVRNPWGNSIYANVDPRDGPFLNANFSTQYYTNDTILINYIKKFSWEEEYIAGYDIYNAAPLYYSNPTNTAMTLNKQSVESPLPYFSKKPSKQQHLSPFK
jgi:hypothetical protein